jgi:tetratricopeptide (TPR) repeat protein
LDEINEILKEDQNQRNLNLKGTVLAGLSRYEEANACFDKALSLSQSSEIQINKAEALYDWAKISFFPEANYDKALRLIDCGLDALPKSEDPSEFYFLKAEILEAMNHLDESYRCYLTAYKEFDKLKEFERQQDYLKNTSDTLINIVGSSFYDFTPKTGDVLDLARDEENEHDRDAIAVLANEKIVGYVANNPYTLIDEVKSASDIKNLITDNRKAEILFNYLGEYLIARLI